MKTTVYKVEDEGKFISKFYAVDGHDVNEFGSHLNLMLRERSKSTKSDPNNMSVVDKYSGERYLHVTKL